MDVEFDAVGVLVEGDGFGPPILDLEALLDVGFAFFEDAEKLPQRVLDDLPFDVLLLEPEILFHMQGNGLVP